MSERVEKSIAQLREQEPDQPDRDDAQYWCDVYGKLIEMTNDILQRTREALDAMPEAARQHVERTNIAIMEEELARFAERQQAWEARRLAE